MEGSVEASVVTSGALNMNLNQHLYSKLFGGRKEI